MEQVGILVQVMEEVHPMCLMLVHDPMEAMEDPIATEPVVEVVDQMAMEELAPEVREPLAASPEHP